MFNVRPLLLFLAIFVVGGGVIFILVPSLVYEKFTISTEPVGVLITLAFFFTFAAATVGIIFRCYRDAFAFYHFDERGCTLELRKRTTVKIEKFVPFSSFIEMRVYVNDLVELLYKNSGDSFPKILVLGKRYGKDLDYLEKTLHSNSPSIEIRKGLSPHYAHVKK